MKDSLFWSKSSHSAFSRKNVGAIDKKQEYDIIRVVGTRKNHLWYGDITINLLDRQDKLPYDYYTYPWEAEANQLDDANLSQSGKSPLPADGYNSYRDLIKLFYE